MTAWCCGQASLPDSQIFGFAKGTHLPAEKKTLTRLQAVGCDIQHVYAAELLRDAEKGAGVLGWLIYLQRGMFYFNCQLKEELLPRLRCQLKFLCSQILFLCLMWFLCLCSLAQPDRAHL